jgi:hypothetical protein
MARVLAFLSAVLFILGLGLLTVVYFKDNGVTFVGIVGLVVLVVIGVGVLGALLHHPRR